MLFGGKKGKTSGKRGKYGYLPRIVSKIHESILSILIPNCRKNLMKNLSASVVELI